MAVILNTPELQAAVQQGFLVRRILDGLMPALMWRAEAGEPEIWEGAAGERRTFTSKGRAKPTAKPLVPGNDPKVITTPLEQWEAELKLYPDEGAQDVNMVAAANSIVNTLYVEIHNLGVQCGESLNKISRAPLYNAALAGWTVADGAQAAVTSLRVARINGFTTARRPDLRLAAVVKYMPVSSTNPLKITVNGVANTVIGFTPDITDDIYGPGILLLSAAVTVVDRALVKSDDATFIHRVGSGNAGRIDDVTPAQKLTLADVRTATTRFRKQNVARHDDGFWHLHLDPTPMSQIMADPEFQRLTETGLASLPDFFLFVDQVQRIGVGCIWLENNLTWTFGEESAAGSTNVGGPSKTYSESDPIGAETTNDGTPSGDPVFHSLLLGAGLLKEYIQKQDQYLTDAGVTGLVGEFDASLSVDEMTIYTQDVSFIMQAAKNRHADQIGMAWKFVAAYSTRPDGVVGDAARYKRCMAICSG